MTLKHRGKFGAWGDLDTEDRFPKRFAVVYRTWWQRTGSWSRRKRTSCSRWQTGLDAFQNLDPDEAGLRRGIGLYRAVTGALPLRVQRRGWNRTGSQDESTM